MSFLLVKKYILFVSLCQLYAPNVFQRNVVIGSSRSVTIRSFSAFGMPSVNMLLCSYASIHIFPYPSYTFINRTLFLKLSEKRLQCHYIVFRYVYIFHKLLLMIFCDKRFDSDRFDSILKRIIVDEIACVFIKLTRTN